MSIRVMTDIWGKDHPTGSHLLVLLAMADYANDEGICWASAASLARKGRLAVRTVFRVLKDLREWGYIEVVREGGDGKGNTTVYRVGSEGCQPVTPSMGDPQEGEAGDGVTSTDGVTSEVGRVTSASIDPSLSASVNSGGRKKKGDIIDGIIHYSKGHAIKGFRSVPEPLRPLIDAALKAHVEIFNGVVDPKGEGKRWIKWAQGLVEIYGEGIGEVIEDAARLHRARGLSYMGPWSLGWAIKQVLLDHAEPDRDNLLRPFGVEL